MIPPVAHCSLGDPCGVGPEVLAHVLAGDPAGRAPVFLQVHGHADLLLDAIARVDPALPATLAALEGMTWSAAPPDGRPGDAPPIGRYDPAWGAYGLRSLEAATRAALGGGHALVTGPLSKRSFIDGGVGPVGHTEFLARAAGISEDRVLMLFDADRLRVATLTRHIPLAAVTSLVHPDVALRAAALVADHLRPRGIEAPRIAVACLDPHCGEWGGLATTDLALREAFARTGARLYGPLAADTLFLPANLDRFDAVLCWYHDQAMIPIKMAAFDSAANVTLGLPVLRTSPAHGPGYDIAGKGIADAGSMRRAMALALGGG
ncbi:MAG: 4-hydroxythreonine-4-phosphate dehydrogenase PdxA [Pseudomonadota bacterium]